MDTYLSTYYPLIGELCIKCGTVEVVLDRFLFGASDLYRQKLADKFPNWPQQATHKRNALAHIVADLMQYPPGPATFGFEDYADIANALVRLYDTRNLVIHGTPVAKSNQLGGLEFAKVTRQASGQNYTFASGYISFSTFEELVNAADRLILFLDACINGLRHERKGWLSIDITCRQQLLVVENLTVKRKRNSASSVIQPREHGQP